MKNINPIVSNIQSFIVSTLIFTLLEVHADPSVSSSWSPSSAQDDGIVWYATGKLSQVSSQIGSNAAGYYYVNFTTGGGGKVSAHACCKVGTDEEGSVATLNAEDVEIILEIRGGYKLVGWSDRNDYGVRCQSAGAEWDRYMKDTRLHELKHHDFSVGYMTQERMSDAFANEFPSVIQHGGCVTTQDEFNDNAQAVLDQGRSLVLPIANNVWKACDLEDNTDNIWPYDTINTSADCPDIPLHVP